MRPCLFFIDMKITLLPKPDTVQEVRISRKDDYGEKRRVIAWTTRFEEGGK